MPSATSTLLKKISSQNQAITAKLLRAMNFLGENLKAAAIDSAKLQTIKRLIKVYSVGFIFFERQNYGSKV